MSWGTADDIDRTAKILMDAGKANNPDDARRYLQTLVLQVAVGPEIEHDPAAQAALATVVNAGRRAYHGGVHVSLDSDPTLTTGWTAGMTASQVVARYGGEVVEHLIGDRPTLVIGRPEGVVGRPMLHLVWNGWSGGVAQSADDILRRLRHHAGWDRGRSARHLRGLPAATRCRRARSPRHGDLAVAPRS